MQHQVMQRTMHPQNRPVKVKARPPARGRTRFPGIVEDARTLGCNRNTLYRALTGVWHLPDLLSRYQALHSKR